MGFVFSIFYSHIIFGSKKGNKRATSKRGNNDAQKRQQRCPKEATAMPKRGNSDTQKRQQRRPKEATATPKRGNSNAQKRQQRRSKEATPPRDDGDGAMTRKRCARRQRTIFSLSLLQTLADPTTLAAAG
jgi:hypothetical protein